MTQMFFNEKKTQEITSSLPYLCSCVKKFCMFQLQRILCQECLWGYMLLGFKYLAEVGAVLEAAGLGEVGNLNFRILQQQLLGFSNPQGLQISHRGSGFPIVKEPV